MQNLLSGINRNYLPTTWAQLPVALGSPIQAQIGSNAVLTSAQVATLSPAEQQQKELTRRVRFHSLSFDGLSQPDWPLPARGIGILGPQPAPVLDTYAIVTPSTPPWHLDFGNLKLPSSSGNPQVHVDIHAIGRVVHTDFACLDRFGVAQPEHCGAPAFPQLLIARPIEELGIRYSGHLRFG